MQTLFDPKFLNARLGELYFVIQKKVYLYRFVLI